MISEISLNDEVPEMGLQGNDEISLVRRVSEGEPDAFDELYRKHNRYAYNLAYRILENAHDAGDATQEAFFAVWLEIKIKKSQIGNFRAFLRSVIVNKCRDIIRKRGARERSHQNYTERNPRQCPKRPDELVEDEELCTIVRSMLKDLSPRQGEAVRLGYLVGLETKEIAEIFEISDATVRYHISQGLRKLRTMMKQRVTEAQIELSLHSSLRRRQARYESL